METKMKNNKVPDEFLPRWQKLLIVLFELSEGQKIQLKYEDVVVAAYKRFPETFHLRGYKEYPDSGDLIHKPLYDMKPKGLLTANQKNFSLTEAGVRMAERIIGGTSRGGVSHFKPSREIGNEIERILSSEAFAFFMNKQSEKIFDTDFFQYLGASVNMSKNEFLNRLSSTEYAIKQVKDFYEAKVAKALADYHNFMTEEKFKSIVEAFRSSK